ncbi:hypothetical protein UPYG_G00241650 [Umbra pygmaea]|uniref:Uncharacterized protein n=1 Tax=Umbra pygmaea TaxID=75934 RepID=A0ABD0WKH1_UMBPY
MSGILRGTLKFRLPMAPRSHALNQRTKISSKPPKHQVSAAENIFVMAVFGLTILGPSGWILANVKNYQKRD